MKLEDQLVDRLNIGKSRYGHGVRVDSDTTEWGTSTNSWVEMAREELLDAIIYIIADYIRNHEDPRVISEPDDNERILEYANNIEHIKNPLHKFYIQFLNPPFILRQPVYLFLLLCLSHVDPDITISYLFIQNGGEHIKLNNSTHHPQPTS